MDAINAIPNWRWTDNAQQTKKVFHYLRDHLTRKSDQPCGPNTVGRTSAPCLP